MEKSRWIIVRVQQWIFLGFGLTTAAQCHADVLSYDFTARITKLPQYDAATNSGLGPGAMASGDFTGATIFLTVVITGSFVYGTLWTLGRSQPGPTAFRTWVLYGPGASFTVFSFSIGSTTLLDGAGCASLQVANNSSALNGADLFPPLRVIDDGSVHAAGTRTSRCSTARGRRSSRVVFRLIESRELFVRGVSRTHGFESATTTSFN